MIDNNWLRKSRLKILSTIGAYALFFNSVESNAYIEEVIVESNYGDYWGDYWELMQYSNNLIDTMDHITVDQTDIDHADLKEEICDLETHISSFKSA